MCNKVSKLRLPHQNNCLHEIMFDAALRTAQELDQYLNDHGKVKGPLHGLPISLKDQFHVKGYDTTMGYVGWIDTYEGDKDSAKVHNVDSQIVKELLSLGAVLYCKVSSWCRWLSIAANAKLQTSLPQTLLVSHRRQIRSALVSAAGSRISVDICDSAR